MKGPRVTLTNGRYEFRIRNGGAMVLADPPEAGWVMERPIRQPRTARDRRPTCDPARIPSGVPE